MEGFTDPWLWLSASSSVGGLWVLLLFAYRRIPRVPAPDDINQLRAEFLGLVDAFQDLAEKHDETIGRSNAKIGSLRRKLRKLQEEEGIDPEEDYEGDVVGQAAAPTVLSMPTRAQQKTAVRAALANKRTS